MIRTVAISSDVYDDECPHDPEGHDPQKVTHLPSKVVNEYTCTACGYIVYFFSDARRWFAARPYLISEEPTSWE